MKHFTAYTLTLSVLLICCLASASERVDHYKGKSAETLEQAFTNLKQYNQSLAEVLKAKEMSAAELNEIHELTYTLENALEKMAGDIESIQASLELLHKASETNAPEKVKALGDAYLNQSRPLVK